MTPINWRRQWPLFQQLRSLRPASLTVPLCRMRQQWQCPAFHHRKLVMGAFVVFKLVSAAIIVVLSQLNSSSSPTSLVELNTRHIELFDNLPDVDCVESFLRHYEEICEREVEAMDMGDDLGQRSTPAINRSSSAGERHGRRHRQQSQPKMELCPCVPRENLSK